MGKLQNLLCFCFKKYFYLQFKKTQMKDSKETNPSHFPFDKANYFIMIAGLVLLVLGFLIMASDKERYGFGFMGITLGPIVLLLGFMVQFVAIFYKKK